LGPLVQGHYTCKSMSKKVALKVRFGVFNKKNTWGKNV